MKNETRPTPETDALIERMSDEGLDLYDREDELKDHAFKLERERDEAREELARMQPMAESVADIIAKRDAMIEVIREAHDALRNLILAKRGGMQPANALIDATSQANDAVKKLKPFLP